MNNENSAYPKSDLKKRTALLEAANAGQLDGLACPECANAGVSVWFTRRSENDYWTWFLCDRCNFEMRAQGSRPPHYSPERERSNIGKRGKVTT
jgi:hypothetical protein